MKPVKPALTYHAELYCEIGVVDLNIKERDLQKTCEIADNAVTEFFSDHPLLHEGLLFVFTLGLGVKHKQAVRYCVNHTHLNHLQ